MTINRYEVLVNGKKCIHHASRCSVAVHRAMDEFNESDFRPAATIVVHHIGKVEYTWSVVADIPFDYGEDRGGMGHSRTVVSADLKTKKEADIEMQKLSVSHSDWKNIRLSKRTKAY